MNRVRPVRQHLALSIPELITNQQISFRIERIFKASGALQIDFELRSSFRCIHAGLAIIAVFDNRDVTLNDFFL